MGSTITNPEPETPVIQMSSEHFLQPKPHKASVGLAKTASNSNKQEILLLLRASGLDADVCEAFIETNPTNKRRRRLLGDFHEAIAVFLSGLKEEKQA